MDREKIISMAERCAEESIKEEYSHSRHLVFDFETFKTNMRMLFDKAEIPHIHEAGKKDIDECRLCGKDIREEIHSVKRRR